MQLFKSFNLAAILAMASAGLDLGHVQDVGDHHRQQFGAVADLLDVLLAQRPGLRDERGAYTCTGALLTLIDVQPGPGYHEAGGASGPDGFAVTCRRKWLAGISAQRGY